MPNFPLSHVAVNLLLIVVIAIQPVAVCWAGVDCGNSAPRSGGNACAGCACCAVKKHDDRCCCCQGHSDANLTEVTVGNSNDDHCGTTQQVASKGEQAVDRQEGPALNRDEPTFLVPFGHGLRLRSVCTCAMESQPLGDATPRSVTDGVRGHLSAQMIDWSSFNWPSRPSTLNRSRVEIAIPAHYAQLHLCIWRL